MAQDLADSIFRSLDAALREKGVGDLSVPRHMKTFAAIFLGRAAAYDLGVKRKVFPLRSFAMSMRGMEIRTALRVMSKWPSKHWTKPRPKIFWPPK
jgi:hypothetical protein